MKKNSLFLLFAVLSGALSAQTYTLPISSPDDFLDQTQTYMFSVTMGKLFPLIDEGKVRPGAGFRIGYAERRIRFENEVIFTDDNGTLVMTVNDDPNIEYPTGFFRRGFSRLEGEYVRIGGSIGLLLGEFLQISTGLNADFRTASKYRNKFFDQGERMRTKLKGNDLLQLNGQQIAWVAQIGTESMSFSYEISLNAFFKDSWGLDQFRYQSFGVVYGF